MQQQALMDAPFGSDPGFLTHHALRIKGFARAEMLADMVALEQSLVESFLATLADAGLASFREARQLWQLTPEGRAAHSSALARDVANFDLQVMKPHYHAFLEINDQFKVLCGDWQLRNGEPNDHADARYDQTVIDRLHDLHRSCQPLLNSMVATVPRLVPYGWRLTTAVEKVTSGERNMFTGVMCGSFHDVWMELHEDLILTQGIDRAAEGSF